MFRATVTLFAVLFVATRPAVAEDEKLRIIVDLDVVDCAIPSDVAEISSHFRKHLRSLTDVEIDDMLPLFALSVRREQITSQTGRPGGFVYVVCVSDARLWFSVTPVDIAARGKGVSFFSKPRIFSLQTEQREDIDDTCKRLVAHFDTYYLEAIRKTAKKKQCRISRGGSF